MKNLRYIIAAMLPALGLAGCADEAATQPDMPAVEETATEITVSATITVDDMQAVSSRAFSETPGEGLMVNVFEFIKGSDPTNSFLIKKYPAEVTSSTTAVDNGVEVNFKFTLTKTSEPRVLQFVVTKEDLTLPYGSMASAMQSLSVADNTSAYWGQLEFPAGYCKRTTNGGNVEYVAIDGLADRFKAIPLIRNFAKVSVSESLDNFELTGFELINVPDAGTVAPWSMESQSIPALLDEYKRMLPYDEANAVYKGVVSPQAVFVNTEADAKEWAEGSHFNSTEPQYVYEHPYEAGRRTYVIVAGLFGESTTVTYYKIDLGAEQGEQNIFRNYDLLRNYHYAVTINSVARAGYSTVKEAIEGTVFNNLSASTETRNMKSLSDGIDLIEVNQTRFVVTKEGQELVFKCKYTKDVNSASSQVDNSVLNFIGLTEGAVIGSVSGPTVDNDSVVYKITTKAPSPVPQEQTFTVVGRNGLSRMITLLSHTPWVMSNIATYNGSENTRPNRDPLDIGTSQGAPLTIYFDLPDGMSEAWFPLQFTLEADRQNIENNTGAYSTLVVTSGQSLWPDITSTRVAYIKTVTYEQYVYESDEENTVDVNKPNVSHTVRCRFRTTVALSDLPGKPTETRTIVKIANPYFEMGETAFTRK